MEESRGGPPGRPSRLLRLFLASSSSSDSAAEREALMETAYPELQTFCQKQGLMFEMIDLRWGIHDDMDTGHKATTPLLLEEIRRCQSLSVGPNFVALLGSQYGRCPLPLTIESQDYEVFLPLLPILEEPQAPQLLAQWYPKDENAVPPLYALHRPPQASPEQEEGLLRALHRAARQGERQGLLSRERRQLLRRSELHWAVEAGLFSAGDGGRGALVFFREAKEDLLVVPPCGAESPQPGEAAGATDAPTDQELLAALKVQIAAAVPPQQLQVLPAPPPRWDPSSLRPQPRPKYLKALCQQFVAATRQEVLASLRPQGDSHHLWQELAHHQALGHEKSQASCWRQALLDRICLRMKQGASQAHAPLTLRGPPGCGKTALLCHLSRAAEAGVLGPGAVVVLRLVGTSQLSLALDSLLHGICLQVSQALGLPFPPVAEGAGSWAVLFHGLLQQASQRGTKPLLLLLDSVEQLGGACWLPKVCPPRVHLVLSATLPALLPGPPEADCVEVEPLSREEAEEAVATQLAAAGRTITPAQQALFRQSFSEGGHALPVALAIAQAQRWASYTPPGAQALSRSTTEEAHHLCGALERLHGPVLVKQALSYLACSRSGLAEAELKDILSLDNEVLSEIYCLRPPPSTAVLRVPPLCWARLRQDLAQWLEDRWADGFLLLGFAHREFSAVVEERYLPTPEDRARCHLALADFFRGTWSWGLKKPVHLPSASKPVSADRKAIPQPLWFNGTTPNQRKLRQLPFHLLRAGRLEELQRDLFGNMSWVACKAVVCGAESLAQDVEACLGHTSCPAELRLLQSLFLLLQPVLSDLEGQAARSVICMEVLARLHSLAPSYPGLIGSLCQQGKDWLAARPHPVLVPLGGFLYPPGGPLRKTLPGPPTGTTVLELSPDRRVLLAGSREGSVIAWDTGDFSLLHLLTGHSAEVRCVRIFGQGTRVASAALDHTLRLWSLASGREELCIHKAPVGGQPCSQLHVDEKKGLVHWVSSAEVSAWHLETAAPAFRIPTEASDEWLLTAVFVPRLVLVTVSEQGALCLWHGGTGQLQARHTLAGLGEGEAPTCSVLLPKLGRMVAGFSGGSLLTISSDGNSLLEKLPEGICFLALSEDEALLAAGFGWRVRVFSADSKGSRCVLASDLMHDGAVQAAAFSADSSSLFTSSLGESIWVWSLTQQGLLTDVLGDAGAPIMHLALWGSTLVSASPHTPRLSIWDLGYDRTHKPLPPNMACPRSTALSHQAKYVCFPQGRESCKVVLWDSEEGRACEVLDVSAPVRSLQVAQHRNLLFAGLASGTVLVFPLEARQDAGCVPPAENPKPVCLLALTRHEEQLATASEDLVQVLDVGQGEPGPLLSRPTYTFYTQLPGATISSLALLAGYRVLYGMTSGELFLYDCPRGQVFPLEAHSSPVTCVEVSHGEKWAVSGSVDSLRCLWDVELGHWKHKMAFWKQGAFSHGVVCACFSKDDRYVFTGSLDQSITVWDVSQGVLLAVQLVHTSITRIAPTADGFVATTRLGYLIRERFHCPQPLSSLYNPLRHVKATCEVTSWEREGQEPACPSGDQREASGRQTHKISQICRIV
ncbi:NACHT domain- and WD repeat-containing protein 1 [Heteronotia binoei]|uniref:NACHT domain- and WD repeat-containing protein 1 n=1 Tax=Heteronotia binoei TaxID=13085 RepID=UPI00292E335F|nr:NACHT domain- and WD repeat-containing protein 1 [Heteronotia binoei]